MCRVLLDLKRVEGSLRVASMQAATRYPQAFSQYPPHRYRTDALHARSSQVLTGVLGVLTAPMRCTPTRAPLCSSCTRCCVTRHLPRGCCACRAHVRNDQSTVPSTRLVTREYPNRSPSPLEARRMAAAQMALSLFARRTQHVALADIYM